MTIGRFLGGIAALIWNPETGQYLLLQRAGSKDFAANSWECVTGRVDQGESFGAALMREVQEELQVEAQFEFFIGATHFYRGAPQPENELLGVVCGCTLHQPEQIRISAEHSTYRWLTAVEIAHFLPPTHWLLPVIQRAEFLRTHLSPTVRTHLQKTGLDLFT
jgi:8-oxo-dGTP pyrophosphatase MutT (NUDIX family)